MSNWLKGEGEARVYLAGVLVKLTFTDQEKAFLLKLATDDDKGGIQNIKVGAGVDGAAAPAVTCFHRTIPRTNYAAFYRRLNKHDIILIGSGSHTSSNTKYAVQWANGSSANIDLDKTSTGVDFLAAPKTLDGEGRPR